MMALSPPVITEPQNYSLIFRKRSSNPIDRTTMAAENPGDFVVFERPVIYSEVVPVLMVMVVLRS
jgi:hypothetical protein